MYNGTVYVRFESANGWKIFEDQKEATTWVQRTDLRMAKTFESQDPYL
jgi:hypothetical protein